MWKIWLQNTITWRISERCYWTRNWCNILAFRRFNSSFHSFIYSKKDYKRLLGKRKKKRDRTWFGRRIIRSCRWWGRGGRRNSDKRLWYSNAWKGLCDCFTWERKEEGERIKLVRHDLVQWSTGTKQTNRGRVQRHQEDEGDKDRKKEGGSEGDPKQAEEARKQKEEEEEKARKQGLSLRTESLKRQIRKKDGSREENAQKRLDDMWKKKNERAEAMSKH